MFQVFELANSSRSRQIARLWPAQVQNLLFSVWDVEVEMSAISRVLKAVRRFGLAGLGYRVYAALVDHWFDWRYGVDTCGNSPLEGLSIRGPNKEHGHRYEPGRVVEVRRLFRSLRPFVHADDVVVDLGSGKGRILLVAANCGFKAATGVEFASELCKSARDNCLRFRQRSGLTPELKIVEGDVTAYEFGSRDSVLVLFNPFDDLILSQVIDHVEASILRLPRTVFICLYNTSSEILDARPGFEVALRTERFGYRTIVYRNRPGGTNHPVS